MPWWRAGGGFLPKKEGGGRIDAVLPLGEGEEGFSLVLCEMVVWRGQLLLCVCLGKYQDADVFGTSRGALKAMSYLPPPAFSSDE